jgi:hypothetical protein
MSVEGLNDALSAIPHAGGCTTMTVPTTDWYLYPFYFERPLTNNLCHHTGQRSPGDNVVHVEVTSKQQLPRNVDRVALARQLCAKPGLYRAVERELIATGDLGHRPTPLFIDLSRLLLLGAGVTSGARGPCLVHGESELNDACGGPAAAGFRKL